MKITWRPPGSRRLGSAVGSGWRAMWKPKACQEQGQPPLLHGLYPRSSAAVLPSALLGGIYWDVGTSVRVHKFLNTVILYVSMSNARKNASGSPVISSCSARPVSPIDGTGTVTQVEGHPVSTECADGGKRGSRIFNWYTIESD
ncbi:hypothetical protein BD309DRAFT_967595 [Dichomitus squalens]|nr:hypothetical protein BD309DRAFT_967595 [Dichomitus squalens]